MLWATRLLVLCLHGLRCQVGLLQPAATCVLQQPRLPADRQSGEEGLQALETTAATTPCQ